MWSRVQNRFLWQRYELHKQLLRGEVGEDGVNEVWGWHGSRDASPLLLCTGFDGVDFRRVRLREWVVAWSDVGGCRVARGSTGEARTSQSTRRTAMGTMLTS